MENEPLEIERKFLIRMPSEDILRRMAEKRIEICQVYLCREEDQGSRRIRCSRWNGGEVYHYNEKIRLTDRTRIEREREITREEFDRLREEADPQRRPVEKVRWCIPYAGHTLELDVFPFWQRQAFCEAELSREDEELLLPEWIEVIREVTEDHRYNNNSLARTIPEEEA